jgi:hypothetical protein
VETPQTAARRYARTGPALGLVGRLHKHWRLRPGGASLPRRARQPEPPTLVQNEPSCYHSRVVDPRVFAILSATLAAVTIGHCYYI